MVQDILDRLRVIRLDGVTVGEESVSCVRASLKVYAEIKEFDDDRFKGSDRGELESFTDSQLLTRRGITENRIRTIGTPRSSSRMLVLGTEPYPEPAIPRSAVISLDPTFKPTFSAFSGLIYRGGILLIAGLRLSRLVSSSLL